MNRAQFISATASSSAVYALANLPLPAAAQTSTSVDTLIAQMTVPEKVSQLTNASAAIPRLGISAYDWWNEALHGVAREGIATVFPQAIGMAATWNAPLIERIGETVSKEARAKFNDNLERGIHGLYHGLTFWAPNINIFRDPRWGRGQETYGEDPCLTATLASAYVRGLQGNDPVHLKVAACAKHFAVHSGPEPLRDHFNVDVDPATLNEFYLFAFRALVQAGVAGVMSAYSSLNGTPCSANVPLLHDKLREEWGFRGYVTSDCGAVDDLTDTYKIASDYAHASALAIKAGVDVSCGDTFSALGKALSDGLITEADLDGALRHLMTIRSRLGILMEQRSTYDLTICDADTPANSALSLQAARESMVLLKNVEGLLPLDTRLKRIGVVGPNADSLDALLGNYNGTPTRPMTLLAALRARFGDRVRYVRGCDYVTDGKEGEAEAAVQLARECDVVIFAGGISPHLEGEEMDIKLDGFLGGDRTKIELPDVQTKLLQQLKATAPRLVYVQMSGSAIACTWEAAHIDGIIQAWYPGENGGTAIVDVLFGDYNPAGRLPVTFYAATSDLPPFEDYRLTGRTYRYFDRTPLYAFGHGLSYTRFTYASLAVESNDRGVRAAVNVTNSGTRDGDEVVQLYARPLDARSSPHRLLCGSARVHLKRGESQVVSIDTSLDILATWNETRKAFDAPRGAWSFEAGASSADLRLRKDIRL